MKHFDLEVDPDDSFEKISKLCKEELGFSDEKLSFESGGDVHQKLKIKGSYKSYLSCGEVYIARTGIGWRRGDPAEITVRSMYFGAGSFCAFLGRH